jgi:hypothetical protein
MRHGNENFIGLSDEQKADDYQYFCDTLNKVYPFWYEVEQNGIDKDALFSEYAERIAKAGTDERFYERLAGLTNAFDNLGHLSIFNGSLYTLHLEAFEENQKIAAPWLKVLENNNTNVFYNGLIKYETNQNGDNDNEMTASTPAVETKMIDNDIAYIKISSFLISSIELDKNVILDFYNKIHDVGNLIIDIRGNSGGSDDYWNNLIVLPNIKQSLVHKSYSLFISDDIVEPFLTNDFTPDEIHPIALLPDFANESYDYEKRFTHYVEVNTKYSASANPYQGKIWILIDESVYSSSENFAIFCKDTGFATLVGQSTGGDGGMSSNPLLFSLPNSGIVGRFSFLYRINSDGSSNEMDGTIPDFIVSEDQDSLEYCIKMIDHGK